jgi:hypothetical protein
MMAAEQRSRREVIFLDCRLLTATEATDRVSLKELLSTLFAAPHVRSIQSGGARELDGRAGKMLGRLRAMPTLDLTDTELQSAAQAARIAAAQAEQDAEKQSSPGVRASFEGTAKRFRELAAKLERARKTVRTG